MNLYTTYNFTIDKYEFHLEVCWDFNLMYLENFLKYGSIYIDSSLHSILPNVSNPITAAEQDYGDLLDLLKDMLTYWDTEKVIFETGYIKLVKIKDVFVLSHNDKQFDNLSLKSNQETLKSIKRLEQEVISDFKMMAENISYLKKLLNE